MATSIEINDLQDVSLILEALNREAEILGWELAKIQKKLSFFEQKYNLKSDVFIDKYSIGEMGDEEEIMEWAGEVQMFKRLNNRKNRLEDLKVNCQKILNQ